MSDFEYGIGDGCEPCDPFDTTIDETAYVEPSYTEPAYVDPSYTETAYAEPTSTEGSYVDPSALETTSDPTAWAESGYSPEPVTDASDVIPAGQFGGPEASYETTYAPTDSVAAPPVEPVVPGPAVDQGADEQRLVGLLTELATLTAAEQAGVPTGAGGDAFAYSFDTTAGDEFTYSWDTSATDQFTYSFDGGASDQFAYSFDPGSGSGDFVYSFMTAEESARYQAQAVANALALPGIAATGIGFDANDAAAAPWLERGVSYTERYDPTRGEYVRTRHSEFGY